MGDSDMGELKGDGAFCGVGMGATMGIGGDGFCFNGASDIDRERRERKEQVTNSGRIVSSAGVVCGCSSSSSSRSISWPFMYMTFQRRIGFAEPSRFGALLGLKARGESRNSGEGGGSPGEATVSTFRTEDGLLRFEDGTWKNGACPVLVVVLVWEVNATVEFLVMAEKQNFSLCL
ncbi:hypothetical protein ARMGADRAFT_1007525 [Armillaria gallica]|uniref:Uncharacterized protein n=1 Tax=Armillaria gallica TaxID=47427 RepID=A0A2H3E6V2_ARMGA|nr:hypothetical protein ARMGADRAFT_1007525 [Armillaria gallica]